MHLPPNLILLEGRWQGPACSHHALVAMTHVVEQIHPI